MSDRLTAHDADVHNLIESRSFGPPAHVIRAEQMDERVQLSAVENEDGKLDVTIVIKDVEAHPAARIQNLFNLATINRRVNDRYYGAYLNQILRHNGIPLNLQLKLELQGWRADSPRVEREAATTEGLVADAVGATPNNG